MSMIFDQFEREKETTIDLREPDTPWPVLVESQQFVVTTIIVTVSVNQVSQNCLRWEIDWHCSYHWLEQ